MIRSYIKERRLIAGARRYPHLLLANGTGRPLSKQALNKLFVELRTKVPGLPDELQPHVLRHSWNDEFSALMDRRNIAPAEEERMRKQQMGWSDNSKMSAVYTKRHTKRRTDKASLDLQTEMMSKGADKE
jgi:integrase